ncbi:MAG TPA: metalloregulator ArsR/SmtB family transcription factor [Holophaga sp.]|nr:metalloregulator ArsR/SmtB family transcription factor [Holophaga sp.]
MPTKKDIALVDQNSERFKALGNPIRLSILRLIVRGPETGTSAGAIQESVEIPASTLSHHLSCLAETGLVIVERQGSFLNYRANFPILRILTDYLWEDCCSGGSQDEVPEPKAKACCKTKSGRTPRS